MPYPHPQYKDLLVYTDKPRAGAFYQVKKSDNLSRLANKAYGKGTIEWWGMINLSDYNSQFPRRKKSTRCQSPVREFPDGFIAFCKPYPVLWIPPAEGGEPRPGVSPQRAPSRPVGPLIAPILQPNATIKAQRLPSGVRRAFAPGRTFSATQQANAARMAISATQTVRDEQYPTIEKKSADMGAFFLVVGIGLAGIVFAIKAGTEK